MASKVPNLDPKNQPKKPAAVPPHGDEINLTPEEDAILDAAWDSMEAEEAAPRTPAEKLLALVGGVGREFGSEPEGDELSEEEDAALGQLTGEAKDHSEPRVSNTTAPVKLLNTLGTP